MRRYPAICFLALLSAAVIYACSSTIDTVATSLVRVEVGQDKVASISINPATLRARAGLLLGKIWNTKSAYAAIPSIVDSMRLSVTGSGMPTISAVVAVAGSDTVSFVVEVPNGPARLFTVEGLRGGVTTWYRGEASADLAGAPVTLTVRMAFVGPGIIVSMTGADTPGCGMTQPCQTIGFGITEAEFQGKSIVAVEAGQYPAGTSPVLLYLSGMTLLCLGPNHTTEILPPTGGPTLPTIQGSAAGTTVDGCKLPIIGTGYLGIDDSGSDMTINNVLIISDNGTTMVPGGILLTGNSTVRNSTIQYFSYAGAAGITINGGNPVITNNIIEGNETGLSIPASTTSPTITGNTIRSNVFNGLNISSSSTTITVKSNSIYCNGNRDVNYTGLSTLDVSGNSWDHDDSTIDSFVALYPNPCVAGNDICSSDILATVTYHPTNAPVPGGCL